MNKFPDSEETVIDHGTLTLPPPPATQAVLGVDALGTEAEPTALSSEMSATAFGVELADGAAGASRRAFLVVHDGGQARVLEVIEGDEVTFGRSSTTTIVIDDPRVSRNHARIYRRGPILTCEDIASRNGTRVNGASVRNASRVVISGDVIRVGSAEIVVASAVKPVDDAGEASIGVAVGDAKMREVFALAKQLSSADTPVLVQGEAGVGKAVVAHQIHRWSPRHERPFVRIDCASLPDLELETALFGREGSGSAKEIGLLESASGGTVLLDNVGDLPARVQASIFGALERRAIARIGGSAEIPIDVRVLGATHRDLPAEVAAKRFREDLYYRISAFTLRVPPLRERHAEIDLFAHLFARRFAEKLGHLTMTFSEDAATQLLRYEWPDNVRELRDVMRQAVNASTNRLVDVACLPEAVRVAQRPSARTRL